MTKDDFHFIVSDACAKAKTPTELMECLNSMVVSGYNVGEEWKKRIGEYLHASSNLDILWDDFLPKPGILAEPDGRWNHEYDIGILINDLKNTSANLAKESILVTWFNNSSLYMQELFLKFIHLTFSSVFTFNATIKIFDKYQAESPNHYNLENILIKLEEIGLDEESKPTDKIARIIHLWENASPDARTLIFHIISRKLDIKMNEKTFFNILTPLINSNQKRILLVPYQRCEKEDKIGRLTYPCMVQLKADGKFQNVLFDHMRNLGLTLNRSGMRSQLPIFDKLIQFNNETKYFDTIWGTIPPTMTGEALVKKPGAAVYGRSALDIEVYERKISNGLLNSYGKRINYFKTLFDDCIDALGKPKILKKLEKTIAQLLEWRYVEDNTIFQVWNMFSTAAWLNLNTGMNCKTSFDYLNHFVYHYNEWIRSKGLDTNFVVIHNEVHENLETIYDLYYKILELGLEGLVVKNFDANIEHGVSTEGIIKVKDFKDCELRVIGHEPGSGQFTGGIGSLICISECGRLKVSVAGLTHKQRGFIRKNPNNSSEGLILDPEHSNDKFDNLIVNVKYNALSYDKNGVPSLSLPSIVEIRTDVTRASWLHEIKK